MTENIKNTKSIKIEPNKIGGKAQSGPVGSNFDSFLGAVDAMAPMNTEVMYQATGSTSAAAVLHGAFTGVTGAAGSYGYGPGGGAGAGYGGFGALAEYPGIMGVGSSGTVGGYAGGYKGIDTTIGGASSTGQVAGTGMNTPEVLNTMNINALKLLELQAVVQSNTQAWNTKSNILSADHRARMAMIEKFAARG
ncbi:MAG: hypothetical protein HYY43_03545 [Deltaproteobacteria bacterium]|nr:hypothetical protein [Deltaproteobacteria bacterium]